MSDNTAGTFALPKKFYDPTKFIALILLPGIGALYFSLSGIWGWPNAEEVVGTITVVDTFLGLLLGISTASYNGSGAKYDGAVVVKPGEPGAGHLEFKVPPEELEQKSEVVLKVKQQVDFPE